MSRVVLVPPNASLLTDPSTEYLHTYLSGEMLVRTNARTSESEASLETPVESGVRLGHGPRPETVRNRPLAELLPEKDGLAYVELIGPVDPAWPSALASTGLKVLRYVPNHAYLCRGPLAAFEAADRIAFVSSVIPLVPDMKPSPRITEAGGTVWIVVQASSAEADQMKQTLGALPGVVIDQRAGAEPADVYLRIKARISAEGEESLRAHPLVVSIEPFAPRVPEDELAGLVIAGQYDDNGHPSGSYLQWLEDHALTGEGISIAVVDTGVQLDHPAFGDRARAGTGASLSWHGTFVAGHAAGNYLSDTDADGYIYGLGTAPAADIFAQDNSRNALDICRETLTELERESINAVIQNNSWGAGLKDPMDYGSLEAQYDSLVRNSSGDASNPQPLTICFSSGNSGPSGLTRPKSAKNIIVTGNSEIYRPTVGLTDSDNINDVYQGDHGSSWGNCGDGRIRPDVVAPGEWTASAGYDTHPGETEYINERLTWGGGSSGASPKTTGACALLTQWWQNHTGELPSPAMLRALIVNGASDMGVDGGIPSRKQGWGRLNLDVILDDSVHHTYVDQTVLLMARGEEYSWTLCPTNLDRPILITLAWTDPPGALGSGTAAASAIVNKLALRVTAGGRTYLGNALSGGWSTDHAPGHKEGADNLQNVFLPSGIVADNFTVTVAALEVTTDCLTNQADNPQQDFALVITNGFVDEGQTPADIFLVIDADSANGPNPEAAARSEETATPGDVQAMNSPLWENSSKRLETLGREEGSKSSGRATEGGWWEEKGLEWSKPETTRGTNQAKDEVVRASLIREALVGLDLIYAAGNTRVSCAANSGKPAIPVTDDLAQAQTIVGSIFSVSLHTQLDALRKWLAGRSHITPGVIRRRNVMVAVGPASKISAEDLATLRRAAFVADLTIVSSDHETLAWLAQRIHRRCGVKYRLAESTNSLGKTVRDSLAEATGGQLVRVSASPQQESSRAISVHSFFVSLQDRQIYIRVSATDGVQIGEVRLHRPGRVSYPLSARTRRSGHSVRVESGVLQARIDVPADGQDWSGEWRVEATLSSGPADARATIDVWAWGGLRIQTTVVEAPAVESSSAGVGYIVSVGDRRSLVQGCDVTIIPKSGQRSETTKRIRPKPRRLNQSGQFGETARYAELDPGMSRTSSSSSGKLSAVVRAKSPKAGSVLEDVAVSTYGTTPAGEPFERALRLNMLRLEPRSAWRTRLMRDAQPHLIKAEVADVRREGDEVVALLLRSGARQKAVSVASPLLRRYLATIDLKHPGLRFGVAGARLLTAVLDLAQDYGDPTSEYGIEEPVPDRQTRMSEAGETSEYLYASRFVPAKHFWRPPSPRAIGRVVVHITDGGTSIEGPISWFKNPVKPDGSPLPVSAHYVIGQNGEVVQMVKHGDVAYHAGSANGDSIGIEHCARAPRANVSGIDPTPIQYAASAALVRWLCEGYGIPMDREHILGHAEADPHTTHTACPNAVWDWDYYMSLVLEGMSIPEDET